MDKIANVPFMISIPKSYRNLLRKMAAENNLSNPDSSSSAAQLAREIIINHLESKGREDCKNGN